MDPVTLIAVVVATSTIGWAALDMGKRDWSQQKDSPGRWIAAMVLLWIVFFPLYLFKRSRVPLKA